MNKEVTASSGNVFADLGFANPEEELLKAKLFREIRAIIADTNEGCRHAWAEAAHRALDSCLRIISAQTPCACREGKPLHTFPDHAPGRLLIDCDMSASRGDADLRKQLRKCRFLTQIKLQLLPR